MSSAAELAINDDHPLALELTSLRSAVARFQHEAHSSALKLQRHSLESALAVERAQLLDRENAAIRNELAVLRAYPDTTPHPATLQVSDLTLALRRLSDKLTYTEDTLLTRTTELANALGDVARGKLEVEGAYALSARTRAREEESKTRERELMRRLHIAEEQRDMTDRVVKDYAELVRNIERKRGSSSSPSDGNGHARHSSTASFSDSLNDSRSSLHKLSQDHHIEIERLHAELTRLHGELENSETALEAERKVAEYERAEISRLRTELDKSQADDTTAAKMVSRYMKFSQSATDSLQTALDNLKKRHGASITTLEHQLAALQSTLDAERRQTDRLRNALDELTEQHAREAYGRRREVSLRLAVVGREDGLAEAARRWMRRAQETLERISPEDALQAFTDIVSDAEQLLSLVDGTNEHPRSLDKEGLGGIARILAAESAVKTLVEELQLETEKRMRLERLLGRADFDENGAVLAVPPPTSIRDIQPDVASQTSDHIHRDSFGPAVKSDSSPSPLSLKPQDDIVDVFSPLPISARPQKSTMLSPPSPAPLDIDSPKQQDSPPSPPSYSSIEPISADEKPFSLVADDNTTPLEGDMFSISFPADIAQTATRTPLPASSPGLETGTSSSLHKTVAATPVTPIVYAAPELHIGTADSVMPHQALLADLAQVRSRYDALQRAFRDCHVALRELVQTLPTLAQSPNQAILQAAVERLNDFSEDARVELEIRIVDEERIQRGYATLLSVPGAITSQEEATEIEAAVRAFVDGTEQGVALALSRFKRKLDDLQHDTASIKLAMHEQTTSASTEIQRESEPTQNNGSWSSLAAGLFTSSRPSSPAPQTFGSVMTSPRLRRATSGAHLAADAQAGTNPFAALGLRVPMPEHVPGIAGPQKLPGPRPRTMSGVYMLGLGMRSTSLIGQGQGSPGRATSRRPSGLGPQTAGSTGIESPRDSETGNAGAGDSDIE